MLRARSFDLVNSAHDPENKLPKANGSVGADLRDLEQDRAIKTDPDETKRRRTIRLVRNRGQSWGFTLQTYGIRNKRTHEVEIMSYVDYVEINRAAWVAGMRRGDIILSVNGESVETCTHRDLVRKIQQCGHELRLVVLFEDCCQKVELHERYLRLKKLLSQKVKQLRGLEAEERRLSQGIPLSRLDVFRHSNYSSSSSDWDIYSEITSPSVFDHQPTNQFVFRDNCGQSVSDISVESTTYSAFSFLPENDNMENNSFSRISLAEDDTCQILAGESKEKINHFSGSSEQMSDCQEKVFAEFDVLHTCEFMGSGESTHSQNSGSHHMNQYSQSVSHALCSSTADTQFMTKDMSLYLEEDSKPESEVICHYVEEAILSPRENSREQFQSLEYKECMGESLECGRHVRESLECERHVRESSEYESHMKESLECEGHMRESLGCEGHLRDSLEYEEYVREPVECKENVRAEIFYLEADSEICPESGDMSVSQSDFTSISVPSTQTACAVEMIGLKDISDVSLETYECPLCKCDSVTDCTQANLSIWQSQTEEKMQNSCQKTHLWAPVPESFPSQPTEDLGKKKRLINGVLVNDKDYSTRL